MAVNAHSGKSHRTLGKFTWLALVLFGASIVSGRRHSKKNHIRQSIQTLIISAVDAIVVQGSCTW